MADDDDRPAATGEEAAGRLDGPQAVERIGDNQPWRKNPAQDLERACLARELEPKETPGGAGGVNDSELWFRLGRVGMVWFREVAIDAKFPPAAAKRAATTPGRRGGRPPLPVAELMAVMRTWAEEGCLPREMRPTAEKLDDYRKKHFPDRSGAMEGIRKHPELRAEHAKLTGRGP